MGNERNSFRAEIEALIKEEADDLSEEEIANLATSEDDSPVLQELSKTISVMKAVFDDLKHQAEEKTAALTAATAATESAKVELAQLEEEEKNAEMPPLTAYYLNQELAIVSERLNRHEITHGEMLATQKQRSEEWAQEKARLQEELHQAGISIEVAKDDLQAARNIKKSLEK